VPGARHHGPSGDHTASHAPDGVPLHYSRHRPEQTTLYRLVQQHAASFVVHIEASTGSRLPRFVECSGWRAAWVALRAMCAQRARARRRARERGQNRTP
jgi:hypothetical protein